MALTKITSRILDSSGVTILGTIATGVWQGTPINQTYLVGQSGTNTGDETLARINALDVTELGTISSGVWNGTAINQTYLVGQSGTNTGDETLARINALDVTELGTVSSGVWQGSVIASAYLDADTAHLSTTQTFTGAKTFSSGGIFSSSSQGKLKLVAGSNEYLSLEFANASGTTQWEISKNNTQDLYFYKGGYRMMLKADGKVGIGTTSPGSKLTVVGGTSTFVYDNSPQGTASSVYRDAVFGSTQTVNTGITIFGTGQTGIAFGDAASHIRGQVRYQHSSDTLELGAAGNLNLSISSGGAATFSDSVITPFLNVSGSASQIAAFNGTGANGGYLAWQTSGTTIADLGTAQQIFGSGGNDTFGINARGARSLILGTNNSAKLTITSGGDATFQSDANKVTINSTNSTQATLELGRSVDTKAKITSGDVSANDLNLYTLGNRKLSIGSNWTSNLDAYEEGVFTPKFSGGGNGPDLGSNYSYQIGQFTRIGNMVFYIIDMYASINTATYSFLSITGLPFTSASGSSYHTATHRNCTALTINSGHDVKFWQNGGYNYIYIQADPLTTGSSYSPSSWDSSGRINISGMYRV